MFLLLLNVLSKPGSLINDRKICYKKKNLIFSAHLISRLSLRVGSTYYGTGGSIVNVRGMIIHPNFDLNTLDYDFGLLELEKPLIFNENISAIRLPQQDEPIPDSTYCKVTGWGETLVNFFLLIHLQFFLVYYFF